MPVISTASQEKSMIIQTGATLTIITGGSLYLNGLISTISEHWLVSGGDLIILPSILPINSGRDKPIRRNH